MCLLVFTHSPHSLGPRYIHPRGKTVFCSCSDSYDGKFCLTGNSGKNFYSPLYLPPFSDPLLPLLNWQDKEKTGAWCLHGLGQCRMGTPVLLGGSAPKHGGLQVSGLLVCDSNLNAEGRAGSPSGPPIFKSTLLAIKLVFRQTDAVDYTHTPISKM